jgi:hypothetical protein
MPYKSKAQARYLHWAHPKGVNLDEWDKSTDFKSLPERAKEHKKKLQKKASSSSIVPSGLLGSVLGAGAGAYMAPEDKRWEGAGLGALAGAPLGIGKKLLMNSLASKEHALYMALEKKWTDSLKGPLMSNEVFNKALMAHNKSLDDMFAKSNLKKMLAVGTPVATVGGGVAGSMIPSKKEQTTTP